MNNNNLKTYFIEVAYLGKYFIGWQKQKKGKSIQQELELKMSILLKEQIEIIGCGRTDAGVNAHKHYSSFNCNKIKDIKLLVFKLNSFLDKYISVKNILEVKNGSNARFLAISREYKYYISNTKNPFNKNILFINKTLDINKLNNNSLKLIGKKDFSSFAKGSTEQSGSICQVFNASFSYEDKVLVFTISANRFLRGMVRAIVGTLISLELNKSLLIYDIDEIIKKKR